MQWQIRLEELDDFAQQFWQQFAHKKVFAFNGDMGAGKTTIITALCKAKGVEDGMSSPTFSIINEYSYEDGNVAKTIYHIDLYRLKNEQEIVQAGVEDCIFSGSICFIEWPQKAPDLFDSNTVFIDIEIMDETTRKIKIFQSLPNHHKEQL